MRFFARQAAATAAVLAASLLTTLPAGAQSEITSLSGNQAADEKQLKFGTGLRISGFTETQGASDTGLWDKKKFVAMRGKLGIRLRRSGYDRRRVAIGGASERQISIQIPQIGDPFLLVLELAKTRGPGQATIERSDHKRYGPLA